LTILLGLVKVARRVALLASVLVVLGLLQGLTLLLVWRWLVRLMALLWLLLLRVAGVWRLLTTWLLATRDSLLGERTSHLLHRDKIRRPAGLAHCGSDLELGRFSGIGFVSLGNVTLTLIECPYYAHN
jgi:hypothetical protein